jgi:hypothetical protein
MEKYERHERLLLTIEKEFIRRKPEAQEITQNIIEKLLIHT